MIGIELEEGETYFPQDDHDDNIDPDRDFSYIDKKIENILGHYQKDFMGGLSAESLGARFGGYGSFLPMQQRSPPILSNQRTQYHISSKSPHNLPLENPTAANDSLPVRSGLASSDNNMQELSESGLCSMKNKSKLQSKHDDFSTDEQKKLVMNHTAQRSLKFRVKMKSGSVFSLDKSGIYSGLGLEMSPSSSLEDSPSEDYASSSGMHEMKAESPSYIVKIMTSSRLPNEEMLSPLHHRLIYLVGMEDTALLSAQALPVERKSETTKDRKLKVQEPSQDNKSKKKELNKERKSRKKLPVNPVELVQDRQYPTNTVALSANLLKENVASLAKEVSPSKASINAVDSHSKAMEAVLTGEKAGSSNAVLCDQKGEVGCLEQKAAKSMKRRDKAKGKSVALSSRDAVVMHEGNMKASRERMEKEKDIITITTVESHTNKRNEFGLEEEVSNKLFRQQVSTKDSVPEKVIGMQKKILEDQQGCPFPRKVVEDKHEHHDMLGKTMDVNVETRKPSKQKPHSKVIAHSQMKIALPSGKEHLSSLAMKKLRACQADSTSSAEPPRRNLRVGSLAADNEEAILASKIPYRSRRDGIDLQREMRKDSSGLADNVNPAKKGRDLSIKDTMMGVSDSESLPFTEKLKEKPSSKKNRVGSIIGKNMEGYLSGGNPMTNKVPVGDLMPTEMEDWVLCEKCEKWRLLPLGMNPKSLPEKWACSMITWLPGKNSCNVSEDETTNGLRALYQASILGPSMQNVQLAYPDGTASLHLSVAAENVDPISGGGRKKNLVKTQINAPRQSVIKIQQNSGEMQSSKHQKRLLRELDAVATTDYREPSKLEKKRLSEFKDSRVPKKMRRVDQQSIENLGLVALSTGQNQNDNSGALRISDAHLKKSLESPLTKAKDRTRNAMTAQNIEVKNVSRKRKLGAQMEIPSREELSGEGKPPVNDQVTGKNNGTEHRNMKKFNVSNIQGREYSTLKKNDGASKKAADVRKSSEKALDLGLSDNAPSSSSSMISHKVKAKVKCSPVGSISSSPLRISEPDHGYKPQKLSVKQLKFKAERATNETIPHKGETSSDRPSIFPRNPGHMSDAADWDCSVGKLSAGKHPETCGVDKLKLEVHRDTSGTLKRIIHEKGSLASQQKLAVENQDSRSVNLLHFHEHISEKGKSNISRSGSKKGPASQSHILSEIEKFFGSNDNRVDSCNVKSQPSGHASKAIEASSSKKGLFHWDANTALQEATNLRDSADQLKISGSGLESTQVLFQAAMKFLLGASLLEPSSNEGGKYVEMTPTAAWSATAKLCEHCAHEFERCNDMASASLAYKCMEVACMRVVYSNSLTARQDWSELDMAVRAAPQVESPSSSASDIDSLNNQAVGETIKGLNSVMNHRNHVISAGNRPNFVRLLNFTGHINLAMEASRRSQSAFAAASPVLAQAGKGEGIAFIKRVLDFSFHGIDELLELVCLAMEALSDKT